MIRNKMTKEQDRDIWLTLILNEASKQPQNWDLKLYLWPEADLRRVSEDKENYPKHLRRRATYYLNAAAGLHKDKDKSGFRRACIVNYALFQMEGIKGNASQQAYRIAVESKEIMSVEDNIALTEIAKKLNAVAKAATEAAERIRDYNFTKTGKPPRSALKKEKDLYAQF